MVNIPIIKQRVDIESTNSYSIMPVFTKLGLYSENKPLIIKQNKNLPFLSAYGDENSGLTTLAEALSMIGYRCCSNLASMPNIELVRDKKQNFNAYVNVGKFSAYIKPSGVEGIITGMFLHRNSPHQEIDIEFLGKNHYGFLANVFYNPGIEGTKLEYGYRGTPTWVDLDFDVTEKFHKYEIEWKEFYIIWRVDEKEIYKRNI